MNDKPFGAFWTISELADDLHLPAHILRYWETRFKQLRPLTRAGNRRYYRPEDVALARQINQWLNRDGYTIKGAQQLLAQNVRKSGTTDVAAAPEQPGRTDQSRDSTVPNVFDQLIRIRSTLEAALEV